MNLQKCCWLVEAWWWCHGNEFPPQWWGERCGNAFILHRGKLFPAADRLASVFRAAVLRHDGYFMLRAGETHFFITSHQNTSRRRSFSGPELLMKTVVFGGPTRLCFCSTGRLCWQEKRTEVRTGIWKDVIPPGCSSRTLLWTHQWFLLGTSRAPVQVRTCPTGAFPVWAQVT